MKIVKLISPCTKTTNIGGNFSVNGKLSPAQKNVIRRNTINLQEYFASENSLSAI